MTPSGHTHKRLTDFADGYLAWVMKSLVDDRGFFWWGWHRHYDVYRDVKTGPNGLWCDWSERYIDWRQLELLGLMSKGNWA